MSIRIAGLPALDWSVADSVADVDPEAGALVLTAAAGVDWTNDSTGGAQQHRAALLGFDAPEGDFTLSARVRVDGPRTTFDAGALAVWIDQDHWAKLCFEYSPQGEAMVVSVVANEWSDDCNSSVVTDEHVHLRIARVGDAYAFHASQDGATWTFVRLLRLHSRASARIGFLAQAPMGESSLARFDAIEFEHSTLQDLRDGS